MITSGVHCHIRVLRRDSHLIRSGRCPGRRAALSGRVHSGFIFVVFFFVKYVTWFLEFAYWLILNFANAPAPCGDRGEMAMAIARLPCALYTQCIRWCFLSVVLFRGPWSCRPQPRGGCREAASRKDTRQELGPWFNFQAYAVCRVSVKSRGRDLRSEGHRPQNRQTLLSARCSRSMRQDVWPMGPTRADRARAPHRATTPRTGGQRPKDRQADATLLRRSVSSPSCGPSPMCLRSATSSCMSLQCSTRLSALSAPPPLHCHLISLPHRTHVSSPRGHDVVDRFAVASLARSSPELPRRTS